MKAATGSLDNAADAKDRNRCPACGADASYRYGRAWNGKARRICLICNRQYVADTERPPATQRPRCPVCRQPMHIYRRQASVVRYRCRNYPDCRTYVKVAITPHGKRPAGAPPDP